MISSDGFHRQEKARAWREFITDPFKREGAGSVDIAMVPGGGLEPPRCYHQRILNQSHPTSGNT
jgi:hypothetical protein